MIETLSFSFQLKFFIKQSDIFKSNKISGSSINISSSSLKKLDWLVFFNKK